MLKKWLREPLMHFLLIGAALFMLYGLQNEGFDDQNKRIVFTKADINRLVFRWEKMRQRPPTQVELNGMIEQQIREQVMYREALAMGLDKNDSIVRKRLAQKVEFISADLAEQVEPSEKDLTNYLVAHPDKFTVPGRIDFVQVYFNINKRGETAKQDASRLLAELNKHDSKIDIMLAGDPSMIGQQHEQVSEFEVGRLFGKDFAMQVFSLPVGSWQGPVLSGYGLHLLRVSKKTLAVQPELSAVRDKVRIEWMNLQRQKIDKAFYKSLRQRYEIVIDDASIKDLTLSAK